MLALLAIPAFLVGLLVGILIVPQPPKRWPGRTPQDE